MQNNSQPQFNGHPSDSYSGKRGLVFCIDDAYVMPLKVLWASLMETDSIPPETPVFIVHEETLIEASIRSLKSFINKAGFQVSFVDAGRQMPDRLPISEGDHVSRATFFRLFVASILPQELDSVVYIDTDTVAVRSVRCLFEVKLIHPIAAVDHFHPQNAFNLWGDLSGNYFQAGLLVIDLNAWRLANYEADFLRILAEDRHRIQWWDQCVLNIAFRENWQRLPAGLNVCSSVRQVLGSDILEEKMQLLHFDGSIKPWKRFSQSIYAHRWYQAYQDAYGVRFDFNSIKTPLWKRVRTLTKEILLGASKMRDILLE